MTISGSGEGANAPAPVAGASGITNVTAAAAPTGTLTELADKLYEILGLAQHYGISLGGQAQAMTQATTTNIKSWNVGDPARFNKGLEIKTVTTSATTSNFYLFAVAVMETLGWAGAATATASGGTVGVVETIQEQNMDYYYTPGDMIAIPIRRANRQYAPVFRILNFTASLTHPQEIQSLYMLVNLHDGVKGNWAFLCNIFTWWIFQAIDKENVRLFTVLGKQDLGLPMINAARKDAGQPPIEQSVNKSVEDMRAASKLVAYVNEYISLQLHPKVSPLDLIKVQINGNTIPDSELAAYQEENIGEWDNAYNKVVSTIANDNLSALFVSKLISASVETYEFGSMGQGAASMAIVTTTHTKLAANYTMCDQSAETKLVQAKQLITSLSPLTRVVKYPYTSAGGTGIGVSTDTYTKIQIPCTNWDDIEEVYKVAKSKIKQISETHLYRAPTVNDAISKFNVLTRDPGVRTAKMSYSPIKATATIDMTAVITTS